MLRTVRPVLGNSAVVATLATALVAALGAVLVMPGAAQAATHWTTLPPKVRQHIAAAPHPYLDRFCDPGVVAAQRGVRTRPVGGIHRRLTVAMTTCVGATAATPADTGVYTRGGHERYLLDRGRSFHRGKRWVTAIAIRPVRRGVVAVVYAGYKSSDPMCCPSRVWERNFHLHWSHATHGRLHRVALLD